jgi:mRNA interferase MazF
MKHKIVLVPFPFDDLTGVKVRPAVCLTEKISNYDHIVIAFITSKVNKAGENTDLLIRRTDPNFPQTGLKVDSVIRLHRLITIPVKIIKREIGVLPVNFRAALERKLRDLFGL